ncbi:MAG: helix-turn-helix domain-containing protein [Actinomycetota bacterium]
MVATEALGRRIREARRGAGLSQSDLEALCGIPKARLSRYENGHVDPSLRTLECLARSLNVSEATLLGDGIDVVQEFYLRLQARGVSISSKDEARVLADHLADSLGAPGGAIGS